LQYAGGGGAVDGKSVASNSLEEDVEGPEVQWEDEMEPELDGVWGKRAERVNIDDLMD
jgi:hypothetical protein